MLCTILGGLLDSGGKQLRNIVDSGGKHRTLKGLTGTRKVYRIVMGAELSPRYAAAFEGMEMETKGGNTILTGEIVDQPHLYGILDRINGLGLRLLSVQVLQDVYPSTERKRES